MLPVGTRVEFTGIFHPDADTVEGFIGTPGSFDGKGPSLTQWEKDNGYKLKTFQATVSDYPFAGTCYGLKFTCGSPVGLPFQRGDFQICERAAT